MELWWWFGAALSSLFLFILTGILVLRVRARKAAPIIGFEHSHVWSPWEPHEVSLWDGPTLVRYAPGQLRTCLDPSCGLEVVRCTGEEDDRD